ncbi:hypothetical protein POTOM_049376 [Populus tomentosa]|uniref:Uncharacterized protein n=1 Tax=Populus tomentosa TaxID=118781 RepID=A0A8X7YBA5_POPTO|nr:hypothetical protein POTOM_049376 [Populus tomentosa]
MSGATEKWLYCLQDTIKMQIDWWSVGMLLSEMLTEQRRKNCSQSINQIWVADCPANNALDDSPAPTPTAGEHFQWYTCVSLNPWLSIGMN